MPDTHINKGSNDNQESASNSAIPNVLDSEFVQHVITPLAQGGCYETLVFIRNTPESALYVHYARSGMDENDYVENAQDAVDFCRECLSTVKAIAVNVEEKSG